MKINYPGSIKKEKTNKITNYGNRGMTLEFDLNETNNYYLEKDIAVIHKKPTPIQVVDTDYGKRKITKAYFKEPSTTDYNGIYKGYYIDYEANNNRKSVPLKYFKEKGYIIKIGLNKRLDYLKIIDEYGGNYGKDGR